MKPIIDVSGQKVEIIQDLIKNDEKALVYLDPPYYPVNKDKKGNVSLFKLYNSDYSPLDFLKLKERCDELTKSGIPFVLSNSDCEFIRFLFKDYPIVEVQEPRGMRNRKGESKVRCLIITNFKNKEDFMQSISTMNQVMEKQGGL